MVRASAAAFAGGILTFGLMALAPSPAAADPLVIEAPSYVPRAGQVQRIQSYGEERYDRPARRVYGRRAFAEDLFEDDGYRVYEREGSPRRIPTARERSVRSYERYDGPRVRRYYDEPEYGYESVYPDERMPRRLAGPPSALGASEGRRTFDPKFARATVPYNGSEPANSIVINTRTRYLYLVQGDGTAIRYGVGVGKEGFTWKGVQAISAKREWPNWHPPAEMRVRRPELPEMMAGGPDNPLGARALYLGNTLYRIHGSNEPWTIGRAVSSGCIRMTNEDVTDLYDRVGVGTTVKVM